jgi:hypothetical protein
MGRLYFRAGADGNALAATMIRESRLTDKRALRHMRRVSKLVMETSRAYAPVDWKGYTSKDPPGHELEKSHRVEEQYGHRGRLEATVMVGGMVGGVDVDLYAEWMHEGPYNLGKASEAKARSTGKVVGERFLERALEDHEDDFEPLLDDLLEGLLG